MGRPLTDRFIGRGQGDSTVLYPLVRINGSICRGYILKQVGSDKFLVEDAKGLRGVCRLSNTDLLPTDGTMCIRFTGHASGYAFRISNNKLKDWHGNTFQWNVTEPDGFSVYVYDNTSHADK